MVDVVAVEDSKIMMIKPRNIFLHSNNKINSVLIKNILQISMNKNLHLSQRIFHTNMEIGDVVFLKSNPEVLMTVSFVYGQEPKGPQERYLSQQMGIAGYEKGDVNCTWFEGKQLASSPFKAKMLTKKQ